MDLNKIYNRLLKEYDSQGWWPILDYRGTNPTKTGSISGYHPNDYSFPKNQEQKFEIICGALLTQNTSWQNVERALINLKQKDPLSPEKIVNVNEEELKQAIRPTGYFNQKGERLKLLAKFFIEKRGKTPTRDELLNLKGVGPETADSILLYAYSVPVFVVDSYTKRIFTNLGLIKGGMGYEDIRKFFEENFEGDFKLYQEFHALIVEHAKRYYLTKKSDEDFLIPLTNHFS